MGTKTEECMLLVTVLIDLDALLEMTQLSLTKLHTQKSLLMLRELKLSEKHKLLIKFVMELESELF